MFNLAYRNCRVNKNLTSPQNSNSATIGSDKMTREGKIFSYQRLPSL